jgi:hypothetical protein
LVGCGERIKDWAGAKRTTNQPGPEEAGQFAQSQEKDNNDGGLQQMASSIHGWRL